MIVDRAYGAFFIVGASIAAIAVTIARDSPRRAGEMNAPAESPTERALAAWARSCPAAHDGICIAHEVVASPHCGSDGKLGLVVHARSAAEAAAARSELAQAIATSVIGGDRHELAMAQLALADDELERYLELGFPAGLDFGPDRHSTKEASVRRFEAWVEAKNALAMHLRARYHAIAALDDPVAATIAASRAGMVVASYADALLTAEIPVDVRTGELAEDKIDAYCDGLTAVAEPLDARATAAFESCVTVARHHARDVDPSEIVRAARPCLDALAISDPDEFASLDEAFAAPERSRMLLQLGIVDEIADGPSYDEQNTRGVAFRIQRDYARARAAYARAIALDDLRPEAHYNLAILDTFEATHADAMAGSIASYRRAVESFARAGSRAIGKLHDDAMARARDAQNVVRQLQQYLHDHPQQL